MIDLEDLVKMVGILYDKYLILYNGEVEQQFLNGYAKAIHDIINEMNADG